MVADGDNVTLRHRRMCDPPAVDECAVGRSQVDDLDATMSITAPTQCAPTAGAPTGTTDARADMKLGMVPRGQ